MKKLITTKSRRRPKQPTPAELERRREERDRRHAQRRTSIRRLLYTREQTGEALGGISISSVIRLEQDGCLSKVRLRGLTGQVFHRVDEVEALASAEA